jgi:predicted DNA-binding transcriptional regulator AlpA
MNTKQVLVDDGLWTAKDVAAYLKVKPRQVLERYARLTGFPKAIRLPSPSGGHGHPRWKAKEIAAWADRHKEK